MNDLEKRLLALQQQIENLNTEVANLVALTSDSASTNPPSASPNEVKPLANRPFEETVAASVGLTRFRELEKESA